MFQDIPNAKDAKLNVEQSISERKKARIEDLHRRISNDIKEAIKDRKLRCTTYCNSSIWDNNEQAALELNSISDTLRGLGYGTLVTLNYNLMATTRGNPSHTILVTWE